MSVGPQATHGERATKRPNDISRHATVNEAYVHSRKGG